HKEGMEQPIKVYIPSIAPSSLMVYRGDAFPQYEGHLFSGALKLTHINRIKLDSNLYVIEEERLFESLNERIRDVIQSKDGLIYFSTDDGNIYKMSPNK
ncbi:MAG: PQQ-dependent sugar dehydrogenase, partial [Campylobacteraceae bacterium]|nr:PQQ-dependent sugar dehydrogenase [Campylobacteraceae bacterium]